MEDEEVGFDMGRGTEPCLPLQQDACLPLQQDACSAAEDSTQAADEYPYLAHLHELG